MFYACDEYEDAPPVLDTIANMAFLAVALPAYLAWLCVLIITVPVWVVPYMLWKRKQSC